MHMTTTNAAVTLHLPATPARAQVAGAAQREAAAAQRAAQTAQRAAQAAQREAQVAQERADRVREQAQQLKEQIRQQIRADFETVQGDARSSGGQGNDMWPPAPPPPPGMPTLGPLDPNGREGQIPSGLVDISAILGITLVCCVVGFPLARAIARWIDRRGTTTPASPEVLGRLNAIEQAVESVAVEVERISEGQRFTTRMLSERTHEPAPEFLSPSRDVLPVGADPLNPTAHAPANARRG